MNFKIKGTVLISSFLALALAGCKKEPGLTNLPSINIENNKPVGTSARALLSASPYTSVKIEIQYMPGFQPDAAAVNNLVTFLNALINKPGGVTVIQTQIASSGKTILSLNEIATIEKNNRTAYTSGTELGVYFLFTDADYDQAGVLGIAYRNTSMSIMGKTVHDNSGGLGQASRVKVETTVMEHEFGHILGLVNIGSPMQTSHQDVPHGNHCTNTNCLMYYASETTDILGILLTGNIPPLDANCKADLTANGGK
jgi:hypothetical protein